MICAMQPTGHRVCGHRTIFLNKYVTAHCRGSSCSAMVHGQYQRENTQVRKINKIITEGQKRL